MAEDGNAGNSGGLNWQEEASTKMAVNPVCDFAAVCRITRAGDKGVVNGSGFFMGQFCGSKGCVMTVGHVLRTKEEAKNSTTTVEFDYNDRTIQQKRFVTVTLDPDAFFWNSAELDATIVSLREDSIEQLKQEIILPLSKGNLENAGTAVFMAGHPSGEPLQFRAGFLRTEIDCVDFGKKIPIEHLASYDLDKATGKGFSGAPVVLNTKPREKSQACAMFIHTWGKACEDGTGLGIGISIKAIMDAAAKEQTDKAAEWNAEVENQDVAFTEVWLHFGSQGGGDWVKNGQVVRVLKEDGEYYEVRNVETIGRMKKHHLKRKEEPSMPASMPPSSGAPPGTGTGSTPAGGGSAAAKSINAEKGLDETKDPEKK